MPPGPLPKYEIMGLETSEHTDGRVHFTGLIETVLGVHTNICGPLARYSDLRSVPETTKSMVRQPKLCEDLRGGTLRSHTIPSERKKAQKLLQDPDRAETTREASPRPLTD